MEYSTIFFNTLPVIIVLASVFIIIVTLLTCARKETPGVELSLSSAVAEENASEVTIGCILKPAGFKFTYIRWYRTGDDQKPIGDVLTEIDYSECNTRPEMNSKQGLRQDPDVSTVCYVNEKKTIERMDDEGAYANINPHDSNQSLIVICDEDSNSDLCDEEDRVKTNTLKFNRGNTGGMIYATTSSGGPSRSSTSAGVLSPSITSSSAREPVYGTVSRKAKQSAPGYSRGLSQTVKKGKYQAFMNEGYGGLKIKNITLEDAGNYTCYVFVTGLVMAKVSTELSVVQGIVVSMKDVDAIESQSRNVNIVCNYTPKQEVVADINWYKINLQGTQLFLASSNEHRRSDRFEASRAPGVGRLKIMDPVSGDEGRYKCEVIRKNKSAAFCAESVLTLPVRVFPYHRESSSISTSYRRPAMVSFVQAGHYHLLAFCEKRRRTATNETRSIVMLRAVVRSRTIEWDTQQTVVYSKEIDAIPPQRSSSNAKGSYKTNPTTAWPENPVPLVVNQKQGHIVVLFNTFSSSLRVHQRSPDWQLYSAHSKDGGKTWPIINQHFPWSNSKQRKDSAHLSRPPRHFELSPGHGIKLSSGTLLVNGFTSTSKSMSDDKKSTKRHDQSVLVQVILTGGKDGMEWRPVGKSSHESSSDTLPSSVSATEGVREELNASLQYENVHHRGASKHPKYFASPGCQAGLVSFKAYKGEDSKHSPTWVLCSKQIKPSDKKFGVRLSKDGCNTWSKESLVLKDGQVGNSDLAYFERCLPDSKKTIRMCGCLYESVSKKDGTERLTLVFNTFKLSSLLQDEEM